MADHDIVELRERSRPWKKRFTSRWRRRAPASPRPVGGDHDAAAATLVTGIFGMTQGLAADRHRNRLSLGRALMIGSAGLAYLFMRRLGIFK